MCKGSLIEKLSTFMVDIDSRIMIVKNVPSQVCKQCGETSYNDDTARHLEEIINSMQTLITEVVIVDFSNAERSFKVTATRSPVSP
jgi:YgiT-type zinc finger domain-containing protein